jgi:heat shock protein HtpX
VQAVGLQTFIWNNNLRSLFLLALFPFLLLVLLFAIQTVLIGSGFERLPYEAYGAGGNPLAYAIEATIQSLPLAIAVAVIWFVIAYFANTAIIDMVTGAAPVERRDDPELYNLLENLCISRGMKTPTLRTIESDGMNAFASGVHEGQFSITVTRGLRERLDRDELEAVLGHELTHIINRDVRTMIIAAVFAGIISLVAQVLARMLWFRGGSRDGRRGGGGLVLIGIASAAVAWFFAILVRMAISRRREFVADAGSVELTKNPDAMITALQKVAGHAHLDAPEEVRGLFLENVEAGIFGLFATHPPIEARIDALVRYSGGKVPEAVAEPGPEFEPDPIRPSAPGPWDEPSTRGGPWEGAGDKGPWG